jgi:hypothetical protein
MPPTLRVSGGVAWPSVFTGFAFRDSTFDFAFPRFDGKNSGLSFENGCSWDEATDISSS